MCCGCGAQQRDHTTHIRTTITIENETLLFDRSTRYAHLATEIISVFIELCSSVGPHNGDVRYHQHRQTHINESKIKLFAE